MREKLIELVNDVLNYLPWGEISSHTAKEIADHLIANGVTIPVRCKECKHCTVTSDGMVCENALPTKRMMDYYIYGSTILARVMEEDFCSHGERRTDDETAGENHPGIR